MICTCDCHKRDDHTFKCVICRLTDCSQINNTLAEEIIVMRHGIHELNEHKNKQIDENREVSKHFDEIDKKMNQMQAQIANLVCYVNMKDKKKEEKSGCDWCWANQQMIQNMQFNIKDE